jgi:hypothetical protein
MSQTFCVSVHVHFGCLLSGGGTWNKLPRWSVWAGEPGLGVGVGVALVGDGGRLWVRSDVEVVGL